MFSDIFIKFLHVIRHDHTNLCQLLHKWKRLGYFVTKQTVKRKPFNVVNYSGSHNLGYGQIHKVGNLGVTFLDKYLCVHCLDKCIG